MTIKEITLKNVRSFHDEQTIHPTSGVNLFVGQNNSGKSTILRCMMLLQGERDGKLTQTMLRTGETVGKVNMRFSNINPQLFDIAPPVEAAAVNITFSADGATLNKTTGLKGSSGEQSKFQGFSAIEPENLFYFSLAGRKSKPYLHSVNAKAGRTIGVTYENLYARASLLLNGSDESTALFQEYSLKILGKKIHLAQSESGQELGLWISKTKYIPITAMGDGTGHILGLLVNICSGQQCIHVIEEPEAEIHAGALKLILELIAKQANENQFFISTHSDIVVRHLGAATTSKVFSFLLKYNGAIPTSTVSEVDHSPAARQEVLDDLGYAPFDHGLWQGYLILEESTAERIINAILIPQFAPTLAAKIRTISADGITNVEAKYSDLHRLFVFLHNTEIYKENSWVLVDGDEPGKKIIAELSKKFPQSAQRFAVFKEKAFEMYYPERFRSDVDTVLAIPSKPMRRESKKVLFQTVLEWAVAHPVEAKNEFQTSASEVIEHLKSISLQLT